MSGRPSRAAAVKAQASFAAARDDEDLDGEPKAAPKRASKKKNDDDDADEGEPKPVRRVGGGGRGSRIAHLARVTPPRLRAR